MSYIYDLTDTWDDAGTTFSAIKMNVTNTASAAASKLVQCQIGGTDKFTVDKDGDGYFAGNVGIGTTSPDQLLHLSADNSATLRFESTKTAVAADDVMGAIEWEGSDSTTGSSGVVGKIDYIAEDATPEYAMRFFTHDNLAGVADFAERLRITSAGYVGIGTSSPQKQLVVSNAGANGIEFEPDSAGASGNRIFSFNRSTSAYTLLAMDGLDLRFRTGASATERMRIDSSGNVGIGTSSPSAKLDVRESSTGRSWSPSAGITTALIERVGFAGLTIAGTTGVNYLNFASASDENVGYIGYDLTNNAMTFRTNGAGEDMRINSSGYVGIGTTSPSALLDVAGDAEINGLTVGRGPGNIITNAASGYQALNLNTTGNSNTASGYQALYSNTIGNNNAAYGRQALFSNTTGSSNAASGYQALYSNTTSSSNTASGFRALYLNTIGNNNVASGRDALYSNTTGDGNTASGFRAGYDNTEGLDNTYVGYNTGRGITTGDYNTILGANVTGLSAGLSNNVIIADGQGNRRINIDSSGYVGIGTTSPVAKLDVVGGFGSDSFINSSGGTAVAINDIVGGLNAYSRDASITSTGGVGGIYIKAFQAFNTGNTPTYMTFHTHDISSNDGTVLGNTSERMRIDSSGNVGVGTNAPDAKLHVSGDTFFVNTVAGRGFQLKTIASSNGRSDNAVQYSAGDASSAEHIWGYGGAASFTEHMRLAASGNLLVGTTSVPDGSANGQSFSGTDFRSSRNTTSAVQHVRFYNLNGQVGNINTSGSATAYATSSDARLKDNISDADDAANLIDAIQVRKFDWKADGSHQRYGMVAQELLEVAPEAVSVPEGEDDMMGVDYSKLVPMLVKEIQSLRARVAQLEG